MALIKVKPKYQITVPPELRTKAGLSVGDLLEAEFEHKKITLTPKSLVDRDLAIALEEVRKGKTYGPFKSAKETMRSLNRKAKKLKKKA